MPSENCVDKELLFLFSLRGCLFTVPTSSQGAAGKQRCCSHILRSAALRPPRLHASSLSSVPRSAWYASWLQRPLCAARVKVSRLRPGDSVSVPPRLFHVLSVPKRLGGLFPWPHADLVLCFGSDRFLVGWLPVVFSLSCTDENSPFCCEGQTMHG